MAYNNDPIFAATQRSAQCVATAAKTTYNDATNAVLLCTAGEQGSLVSLLRATPRATVAATQLQLYISIDGGTTLSLIQTELLAAYTIATNTKNFSVDFGFADAAPLRLGPNERLYAAIGVAVAGGVQFVASLQDL